MPGPPVTPVAVERPESLGPGACLALLAAVPAAWLVTWLARGVSTPAVGGPEDFPYQAVLAIGLAGPAAAAVAVALLTRSSWEAWELVLVTLAASLALWLGAQAIMLWPGWMSYVCSAPGVGPHLLFRRITTLVLLRPEGGYRSETYGAGPAIAGAVAAAGYLAGGLWALRGRRRALWAWPAVGCLAMVAWVLTFAIVEGEPVLCTT